MKAWKKPTVISLGKQALTDYIKVAARSIACWSCDFR